jgi:DNA (cytosine-5)-methyltransferase 1
MEKEVVELFAGVGGFRVGLNSITSLDDSGKAIENGDWKFVWANQWEPSTKIQHAYECYKKRFGECVNISIQDIDKNKIPNHALLVGGFPCQDYSVARSISGEKGIQGKKGVLFWEIADILKCKQTPFVLLENVDRLLKSPTAQRGRDFGIMLRTFHDLEYNVEWRVVNAAEYGARQKRRRIFIFAWRKNTKYNSRLNKYSKDEILNSKGLFAKSFKINNELSTNKKLVDITANSFLDTVEMTVLFKFLFENTGCLINGEVYTLKTIPIFVEPVKLREVLQHNVNQKYYLNEAQNSKFAYLKGSKKIERTGPNNTKYLYSEGACAYPDKLDSPGRTMLTSEGTINRSSHIVGDLDSGKNRFITPIEAERLQHFPDDWTNTGMPERSRYFMMGNALVTKIISIIEPELFDIIESE